MKLRQRRLPLLAAALVAARVHCRRRALDHRRRGAAAEAHVLLGLDEADLHQQHRRPRPRPGPQPVRQLRSLIHADAEEREAVRAVRRRRGGVRVRPLHGQEPQDEGRVCDLRLPVRLQPELVLRYRIHARRRDRDRQGRVQLQRDHVLPGHRRRHGVVPDDPGPPRRCRARARHAEAARSSQRADAAAAATLAPDRADGIRRGRS